MVCVRQESLVTSPLHCFECAIRSRTYLYHQCVLHGRITIFFFITVKPILISPLSLLVSFVMHHQNDTIQSTGEALHLRLDLLQCMQLPVNNPFFTSYIISDKCGNNCVLLYSTMTTKNTKRKQLLWFSVRLWGISTGKTGFPSPCDSAVHTLRATEQSQF